MAIGTIAAAVLKWEKQPYYQPESEQNILAADQPRRYAARVTGLRGNSP